MRAPRIYSLGAMKFGIFYEHQLPRPWSADGEYRLLHESLAQIELADGLGYDYAWEVEHHFLEEYSHSSAPEVFLGAASQRTRRIRLGHGVIQLPTNHPIRVAERVSTLDLLSGGRVELGLGEAQGPWSCIPSAGESATSATCGKKPSGRSSRASRRRRWNSTAPSSTFPRAM